MNTTETLQERRRRSARALSRASRAELADLWQSWPDPPEVEHLRAPETGLVMVQGRVGGGGDRFNLGEATVTRATVRVRETGSEAVGTAYVLGTDHEHAELAAIFDAMLNSSMHDTVLRDVIAALEHRQLAHDAEHYAQGRSTVVEFFTAARENSGADEDDE
ncbi:phosphonate C-P lyase system protein PhnG [Mycolicibacterium mengxianglii]|uniref:phosphonate C-P lyase system protein PhnG n=1 Tax=Mycolicibacterium mengxianglii TaxID=2736649 RepID=UPI0018D09B44|nr:phosphonate C-P lyase system protein PhnG [Mycolicibacterium mengxianglii]